MPLYYFHLRNGRDALLDPDGQTLIDMNAIVGTALREARAIIGADALDGKIWLAQHIDVEDACGAIVHRLDFEDAVEIERGVPT